MWSYLKGNPIANLAAAELDELTAAARHHGRSLQRTQHLLRSFLARTPLPIRLRRTQPVQYPVGAVRGVLATPTQEAFPVKRMSANSSRRNSARRQRKVAAQHAQAGHWSPQSQPTFTSAPVLYA